MDRGIIKKLISFEKKPLLLIVSFALFLLILLAFYFNARIVYSETPPFTIKPVTPLNTSTGRYANSFFYGTPVDPNASIDDDVMIYDTVQIFNLDPTRSITVALSGRIAGQEGWFAFSENPVVIAPGFSVNVPFSITVPDGVCTKIHEAYLIVSLESYDGMDLSSGMAISASMSSEVFFNIDSGIPCFGGEVYPGLGVSPAYVPLPAVAGDVPVYVSPPGGGGGGGGGGSTPDPDPEDICDDGIDNDSDGDIDCDDSDCMEDPICQEEEIELICDDGIDNDSDGDIDCDDSDCMEDPVCQEEEIELICDDGIDNDSDGDIDCDDSDCMEDPVCQEEEIELICDDGIDNDSDGDIDCDDSDCMEDPYCQEEEIELICDDGIDNDSDGDIDCDDSDCMEDPYCLPEFTIKALPEKRVFKSGGNYYTRGLLKFNGIGVSDKEFNTVIIEDDGYGTIENDRVTDGWYDVSFKGLSHLTKYLPSAMQIEEGVDYDLDFSFSDSFYLKAGDVASSKDDYVNSLDIAATVIQLYLDNEHADLNRDYSVNSLDLAIEFYNLYESGEIK